MSGPPTAGRSPLADTLFRIPRQNGLHAVQTRGQGGVRELSSWRLKLGPRDSADFRALDEEAVLILQEGAGLLETSGDAWEVSRAGVFDEPATALYLPPGANLTVTARSFLEAIIVAAPAAPAKASPTSRYCCVWKTICGCVRCKAATGCAPSTLPAAW